MDPGLVAAIGQSLGDYFRLVDNFLFGERDALLAQDAKVMDARLNPFLLKKENDNSNLFVIGGLVLALILISILFFKSIKK